VFHAAGPTYEKDHSLNVVSSRGMAFVVLAERNAERSDCEATVTVLTNCSRFFTVTPNETTRGHTYKLFVHHSRVDIRKHFFVIG